MTPEELMKLPVNKKRKILELLEAQQEHRRYNLIDSIYPEEGPLRRELYTKHMEFYKSGADYQQRLLMAGNRTGKTFAGGYEAALHLTGNYPEWWEGRLFNKPVRLWAAGKTSETTRDIIQHVMVGEYSEIGTGMIPKADIIHKSPKAGGVPGAIDTVSVRYKYGHETSTLGF